MVLGMNPKLNWRNIMDLQDMLDASDKTSNDTLDLAALMSDFTVTAGSVTIALVSSVKDVEPIFVGSVSLYNKGHDYHKQSHSILLNLAEDIATSGNGFDLSNIKLPLKGGWASMFKKPDPVENSSEFFGVADMQKVIDDAKAKAKASKASKASKVTDANSLADRLSKKKVNKADSFMDDLEGYLNVYLTFRDVDYRLKDFPLTGRSLWERAIISYLEYQAIKNPDSNFSDYMNDFKFVVTELRLTEELDLDNVQSGF